MAFPSWWPHLGLYIWDSRNNKKQKTTTIIAWLKQIINTYHGRRFKIQHILADGLFESTRKHIEPMGIILNITGCNKHVPEIEQYIRTAKERVHAILNTLTFQNYSHRMITETVYNAVLWLNCFLHKNSIHTTLSPRAWITYWQLATAQDIRPNCPMTCRQYARQQLLVRNNWMPLPMHDEVITTVHQLAVAFKKYGQIIFTDNDRVTHNANNSEITGMDGNTDNGNTITNTIKTAILQEWTK